VVRRSPPAGSLAAPCHGCASAVRAARLVLPQLQHDGPKYWQFHHLPASDQPLADWWQPRLAVATALRASVDPQVRLGPAATGARVPAPRPARRTPPLGAVGLLAVRGRHRRVARGLRGLPARGQLLLERDDALLLRGQARLVARHQLEHQLHQRSLVQRLQRFPIHPPLR
jgi:hypothetical protein